MAGQLHPTGGSGDAVSDRAGLDPIPAHDDSVIGRSGPVRKICVVCGADVAGKPRMKDAEGRYWCYECGLADTQRKHPVPCADCGRQFPQSELTDFQGQLCCTACADHRRVSARREAARIAAAEEEARRQERRRHYQLLAGIVLAAVVTFLLLFWLLMMR